jgi:hypothetical protein
VLTPWEPRRATLVERVVELPSLWVGSCDALVKGLAWCQLAHESPSVWSTQRGLAWWQPSEPRDKNHHIILILPIDLHPRYTSLYLPFIYCACVVALVSS